MSLNKWIGYGRLCADPVMRQTNSGMAVCSLRVAVNRRTKKDGQPDADFINCTAFGNTAEFVCRYFTKGSAIIIEGRLQNKDYTDSNGVKHYGMEILLENANFGESKKNAADSAQNAPQGNAPQFGAVTPQIAQTSNSAQSGANNAQSGAMPFDLNEFEEILGGDSPF